MPSIADQVATIEHDLTAALALIDTLNAANAALTAANTGLRNDNVALQLEVNDMKHFVDDTRTMAEQLASSALDMLRASRRQVGTPVAPKVSGPFSAGLQQLIDQDRKAVTKQAISDVIDADPRFATNLLWRNADGTQNNEPEPPAQQAVAEIITGDTRSCTCHPDDNPPVPCARKYASTECKAAAAKAAQQAVAEIMAGDSGDEQPDTPYTPAAPIGEPPAVDAMSRIQATVPINVMKLDGPTMVEHDADDLPVFLQPGTAFDTQARAQVFG